MDWKVNLTLQATHWSGWDSEGYSIVKYATLNAVKGTTLSPLTLGATKSDYQGAESLFYEVLLEHVVADRVGFTYNRLVIANPTGTINLTAPNSGRFILRPGETKHLSTSTMDDGTSLTVTLHHIREPR